MKYSLNIFLVQNLPEIIDFSAKHSLQFVAQTKGGVHGAIFHNRVHLVEFLECTVENYLESYLLHLPVGIYITSSEAVACCDDGFRRHAHVEADPGIDQEGFPFGVEGESTKLNVLAVQVALKALASAKRSTNIFVSVGDTRPSERIDPPAGI